MKANLEMKATNGWQDAMKKVEKIIRENAFEQK